jgi:hypothetical protein
MTFFITNQVANTSMSYWTLKCLLSSYLKSIGIIHRFFFRPKIRIFRFNTYHARLCARFLGRILIQRLKSPKGWDRWMGGTRASINTVHLHKRQQVIAGPSLCVPIHHPPDQASIIVPAWQYGTSSSLWPHHITGNHTSTRLGSVWRWPYAAG